MTIYEFLQRLDADPFDAELTALFIGDDAKNMSENDTRTEGGQHEQRKALDG